MSEPRDLGTGIRRGLAWSALNNLVLRVASLAVGVALARLLSPEEFGVYAVALTVQAVVIALADLGMSADLIRVDDPRRRAPTVATLGLVTGGTLAAMMATASPWLSAALGSPESSGAIALLSITIVLAGAGVVPYAMLQRRFEQKRLFMIAIVDFTVSTTVTIGLVVAGWGVISLAVGRVLAQLVTLVLQYVLARERPMFGLDMTQARSVLAFGLPVAGANLLSWALLGADKIVISREIGPVDLGYYVLAFNISTWPMTAIGQVVRSVALAGFARIRGGKGDLSFARALAPTWALALPISTLVAVLSTSLVTVVYGEKWATAATVLVPLAAFGAIRVVFDLIASYLYARGASGIVLWIQLAWFAALIPALAIGARTWGILGAATAHVLVSALVVLPLYIVALHRSGAAVGALWGAVWPPILAAAAAAPAAMYLGHVGTPLLGLIFGGLGGAGIYGALIYGWLARRLREASTSGRPADGSDVAGDHHPPLVPKLQPGSSP